MGRHATSGIKQRKRTTVYLTKEIARSVDLAYIDAQKDLGRLLDKTLFVDALLTVGLNHTNETQSLLG